MYKTIEQLKEMDWYSAVYTARNDEVQAEYGNRSSPRSSLFSFSFFFFLFVYSPIYFVLCVRSVVGYYMYYATYTYLYVRYIVKYLSNLLGIFHRDSDGVRACQSVEVQGILDSSSDKLVDL